MNPIAKEKLVKVQNSCINQLDLVNIKLEGIVRLDICLCIQTGTGPQGLQSKEYISMIKFMPKEDPMVINLDLPDSGNLLVLFTISTNLHKV